MIEPVPIDVPAPIEVDEGARARFDRLPITACPYSAEVTQRALWELGWNATDEALVIEADSIGRVKGLGCA